MKQAGVRVGVGTHFTYDGQLLEAIEMHPAGGVYEIVAKDLRTKVVRRFALDEIMFSDRARLLTDDLDVDISPAAGVPSTLRWAAASELARNEARERAAHVREVLTGYRTGSALTALPHEPRVAYVGTLPKLQRLAAKATEIGNTVRTIQRWVRQYEAEGEIGLLPSSTLRFGSGSGKFALFEQTASDIMREYTDASTPTMDLIINHTRARIEAAYGKGAVKLPSPATAYRILSRLEQMQPLFSKSTKRVRDIAARSARPYGALLPSRPGEYLLMDTIPLDVFAMDPQTLQWVGVELTVAMDWYSRCIVGLALTPTTKAVDVAAVLYQAFRPPPAAQDWPAEAVWLPHGVPRSVLVETAALHEDSVMAATPALMPETLVVDHGKVYVSEQVTSTCRQLGISIQPARVRTGRDKGPVERFFRTVRQSFLQELPGYKGPDVSSRGLDPERDAFFFLDELEALLREWVACVYHRRAHDGVGEVGLWKLKMSPAQMFEHGIARAGYIEVPRDPDLAYSFLKVQWRTIQHYGVEIDGRVYRGPGLTGYAAREKSNFTEHNGQWPFHIDPIDIRYIYFYDLKNTEQWQALTWKLAPMCGGPFTEDGLHFARQEVKKNHKYFDDKLALAELLERRHLCQSRTVAERRTVLRISRAQSSLFVDTHRAANVPELPVARQAGATSTLIDTDIENLYESDELDDFSADDGALYDEELLEDL